MKLVVQGIEEIELTDPAGLCQLSKLPPLPQPQRGQPVPPNPPVPQQLPSQPRPGNPMPTIYPTPQDPIRPQPAPPIYTRKTGDPFAGDPNWGVGGPMIQRAGEQVDSQAGGERAI